MSQAQLQLKSRTQPRTLLRCYLTGRFKRPPEGSKFKAGDIKFAITQANFVRKFSNGKALYDVSAREVLNTDPD